MPDTFTEGNTDWQTVGFDDESNDDDGLVIETVQLRRPLVTDIDLQSDENEDHGTVNNDYENNDEHEENQVDGEETKTDEESEIENEGEQRRSSRTSGIPDVVNRVVDDVFSNENSDEYDEYVNNERDNETTRQREQSFQDNLEPYEHQENQYETQNEPNNEENQNEEIEGPPPGYEETLKNAIASPNINDENNHTYNWDSFDTHLQHEEDSITKDVDEDHFGDDHERSISPSQPSFSGAIPLRWYEPQELPTRNVREGRQSIQYDLGNTVRGTFVPSQPTTSEQTRNPDDRPIRPTRTRKPPERLNIQTFNSKSYATNNDNFTYFGEHEQDRRTPLKRAFDTVKKAFPSVHRRQNQN
jgi:hypothetical protein